MLYTKDIYNDVSMSVMMIYIIYILNYAIYIIHYMYYINV